MMSNIVEILLSCVHLHDILKQLLSEFVSFSYWIIKQKNIAGVEWGVGQIDDLAFLEVHYLPGP